MSIMGGLTSSDMASCTHGSSMISEETKPALQELFELDYDMQRYTLNINHDHPECGKYYWCIDQVLVYNWNGHLLDSYFNAGKESDTCLNPSWQPYQPMNYSNTMEILPTKTEVVANNTYVPTQESHNATAPLPYFDTFCRPQQTWSENPQCLYVQPDMYYGYNYQDQQFSPSSSSETKSSSCSPHHSPLSDSFFVNCMAKKTSDGTKRRRSEYLLLTYLLTSCATTTSRT